MCPNSDEKFHLLLSESDALRLKFEAFVSECQKKSEVCQYLGLFEGRVYLPRHGAHKARKVRWITRDGANNS